jgi:hypothetical protein
VTFNSSIANALIDCVVNGLVTLLGVIVTKDCRFFSSFVILILLFYPSCIGKDKLIKLYTCLNFLFKNENFN